MDRYIYDVIVWSIHNSYILMTRYKTNIFKMKHGFFCQKYILLL